MNKISVSVGVIFLILVSICSAHGQSFKPEEGYVPDAKTAIRIALAVWEPIYGIEKIKNQAPYKAELRNQVWFVTGSLEDECGRPMVGGVAEAEISKKDGRILSVIHGK